MFTLHRHLTDPGKLPDIEAQCRAGTRGCVDCKRILAESIADHFAETRERAAELMARPARVREILDAGADRARAEAATTMEEVRERMGLLWRTGVPAS